MIGVRGGVNGAVRGGVRLLIANRGEIAVRVARAAREFGMTTVAVYTPPDRASEHVAACDHSVPVPSYLDIPALVAVEAEAVHPGYGFLAENTEFARAVIASGKLWVGPPPDAIAAMGDKLAARRRMQAAGVPVVPGVESADAARIAALGFPVMVKASKGGGGRGMRIVTDHAELEAALSEAGSESLRAFGDATVYAERYVSPVRHVEVQVLADRQGNTIHLGERECSVQRRNQKVVEEAPSPGIDDGMRERMGAAAVAAARAVAYEGAGTVEFLVAGGEFWFLEMNTRVQVEHPVTEQVWGVDLVQEQLRIAVGEPLSCAGAAPRGHAIECRIYAEDPSQGFLPSPGRIRWLREPQGPGIRVDGGVVGGSVVGTDYDPMLAKLIVHAGSRREAIARMAQALARYEVAGIATTAEYLRDVVSHPAFVAGDTTTDFLARHFAAWRPPADLDPLLIAAMTLAVPKVEVPAALPTPWQSLGAWGRP